MISSLDMKVLILKVKDPGSSLDLPYCILHSMHLNDHGYVFIVNFFTLRYMTRVEGSNLNEK